MIDSISIKNFRCFESAEASGLGRVNVVVGDNRAGKTAFLEALYLVSGNTPQNHLKVDAWRGLNEGQIQISEHDVSTGLLWRDLFFDFDQARIIGIKASGSQNRALNIMLRKRAKSVPVRGTVVSAIEWTWAESGNYVSVPRLEEGELKFPNTPPGIAGAMLSTSNISANEMAKRYSDLDIKNEAGAVLALLRKQFPEITGLSTQVVQGDRAMLYATVEGMREKIALPLISAGLTRLLYILLTIHVLPGGAVGIDEIDNGIFYDRYSRLWEAVDDSSRERGTQVFASVHSIEALKALLPVIERQGSDFRLIRVTREPGRSQLKVVGANSIAAAISGDVEMR